VFFNIADGRLLSAQGQLADGGVLEGVVLVPHLRGLARARADVKSIERKGPSGETVRGFQVDVRPPAPSAAALADSAILDADGGLLRLTTPGFTRRVVDREKAQDWSGPARIRNHIPVQGRIDDLERVRSVRLDIEVADTAFAEHVRTCAYQTVQPEPAVPGGSEGRATRRCIVTLHAVRPDGARPAEPLADDERARYLSDTEDMQVSHPDIKAAAAAAAGAETSPMKTARRISRWVGNRLKPPDSAAAAWGTALEALKSGRGDCTEHAVLAAALARARGIPARVVNGMVYRSGRFILHTWAEFHVGGAWTPVDTTRDRLGTPAQYIMLWRQGENGSWEAAALDMLQRAKVRVVESE
jgi:hypothetical protein